MKAMAKTKPSKYYYALLPTLFREAVLIWLFVIHSQDNTSQ
jgi:hypothetical protein